MSKIKVGDVFGSLTVQYLYADQSESGRKRYMALCTCSCGIATNVERGNLSTRNTKRCPICASISRGENHLKHGNSYKKAGPGTIEAKSYSAWQSMKSRCSNKNNARFNDYGGRGVYVCERWIESYEAFLDDMGLPPIMECQIDRINNNGCYEKENCRWVSREENSRNKRSNCIISAFGKTQTLAEWAVETGIKRECIAARIKRGYTGEQALSIGSDRATKKKYSVSGVSFTSIRDAAESHGLSVSGAHGRFMSEKYPEWVSS